MAATQHDFNSYYEKVGKYSQANTGGSGGLSEADMKRWAHVIRILSPRVAKGQRIVDVGCGKGGLLLALRAQGFTNVVGVEPSKGCREVLAKQAVVCYRDIADCLSNEAPFDCVICSQVLEHVFSLNSFLEELVRLLGSEGVLYVEVPNAAAYCDCFHAPFYYFDREHINHFTRCSLDNLFAGVLQCQPLFREEVCAEPITGVFTPNLYAIYKPCNKSKAVVSDVQYSPKIQEYVKVSECKDHYLEVESLNGSSSPVLLWGYGAHLRRLMKKNIFQGLPIRGVIDRDRGGHGEYLNGLPVLSCKKLAAPEFQGATVIITSVLYAKQIFEALSALPSVSRIVKISD
jgi:2-polyprenyl-3-methyl-5-hydroxy-6-metoxy-1,4-benzoquinol methylase